jgi:hypothetical protein
VVVQGAVVMTGAFDVARQPSQSRVDRVRPWSVGDRRLLGLVDMELLEYRPENAK